MASKQTSQPIMSLPKRQLAYCTNVHAGADLDCLVENLRQYSMAVKHRFSPNEPMGVGLWLAAPAATKLLEPARLADFAAWLSDRGLVPFTLNGFPYGDFHQPVVKHRVYHPTWFEPARLRYTLDLITILDAILPDGMEGSISTLPIAWREPAPTDAQMRSAADNLCQVARCLAALEAETGRLIYVCIEPEPGCVLQRGDDVVRFVCDWLLPSGPPTLLRYIRVCHDICHTAVMFECQEEVLASYAAIGLRVGKVQVSSAVRIDFDSLPAALSEVALSELASFAEDRYLHQTVIRSRGQAVEQFVDDLPAALAAARKDGGCQPDDLGQWRVHFHVPIFLKQFGAIGTTRDQIQRCLHAVNKQPDLTHFEVETYAWSVLPPDLRYADLAEGIAAEMEWLAALPEYRRAELSSDQRKT